MSTIDYGFDRGLVDIDFQIKGTWFALVATQSSFWLEERYAEEQNWLAGKYDRLRKGWRVIQEKEARMLLEAYKEDPENLPPEAWSRTYWVSDGWSNGYEWDKVLCLKGPIYRPWNTAAKSSKIYKSKRIGACVMLVRTE
jgi:hypothetical protein